ncbi:MAG: hypothetical protein WB663_07575 [Beijerinckiaceae bacterium]|jgi:bifunctional non-homologous end joining protein LigD
MCFSRVTGFWRRPCHLPVKSAVLDGEAIVMRSADRCDFEALRSREGQADAILVAYDVMEVDGQDVRPEPLD